MSMRRSVAPQIKKRRCAKCERQRANLARKRAAQERAVQTQRHQARQRAEAAVNRSAQLVAPQIQTGQVRQATELAGASPLASHSQPTPRHSRLRRNRGASQFCCREQQPLQPRQEADDAWHHAAERQVLEFDRRNVAVIVDFHGRRVLRQVRGTGSDGLQRTSGSLVAACGQRRFGERENKKKPPTSRRADPVEPAFRSRHCSRRSRSHRQRAAAQRTRNRRRSLQLRRLSANKNQQKNTNAQLFDD